MTGLGIRSFQIRELADVQRYIKVMVYGPPGGGKTEFVSSIATVPELCPALYAGFAGGEETIIKMMLHNGISMRKLKKVLRLTTIVDLDDIATLLLGATELKALGFNTLIIDSATEAYRGSLVQQVHGQTRTASSIEVVTKIPQLADWGAVVHKLTEIAAMIRDAPIHVVVTALEMVGKTTDEAIAMVMPDFPGKASARMAAAVRGCYRMRAIQISRGTRRTDGHELMTSSVFGAYSKDCYDVAPEDGKPLVNQTFAVVYEAFTRYMRDADGVTRKPEPEVTEATEVAGEVPASLA